MVRAVHGDERVGVDVIKRLKGLLDPKKVRGIIANRKAFEANVRFFEQDLNRSFPGSPRGNYEERTAYRLTKLIKKFDYVLDLHSFSCQSDPFVIITKKTAQHLRLARAARIRKVVFMSPKLAQKRALIDHCRCGISVEAGRHGQKNTYNRAVGLTKYILSELGFLNRKKRRFLAPYDFYPILARERAYSNILCLAAKPVKIREGVKI